MECAPRTRNARGPSLRPFVLNSPILHPHHPTPLSFLPPFIPPHPLPLGQLNLKPLLHRIPPSRRMDPHPAQILPSLPFLAPEPRKQHNLASDVAEPGDVIAEMVERARRGVGRVEEGLTKEGEEQRGRGVLLLDGEDNGFMCGRGLAEEGCEEEEEGGEGGALGDCKKGEEG